MMRLMRFICAECRFLINPLQEVATRARLKPLTTTRSISKRQTSQPKRKVLSTTVRGPREADDHLVLFAGMNRRAPGALNTSRLERGVQDQRSANLSRNTKSVSRNKSMRGEMRSFSKQHILAQIPYDHRNAVKTQISHITRFEDFVLLPTIINSLYSEALCGMTSVTPTPIQRLAIPTILQERPTVQPSHPQAATNKSFKSYLLAAETGSGKTLAYLLPTINNMKQRELFDETNFESGNFITESDRTLKLTRGRFEWTSPPASERTRKSPFVRESGRPQVVVLLPTAELVEQVGALFKMFSHRSKYRAVLLSASYSATTIRNRLFGDSGVDVVVSTPHILSNIAESDPNILGQVSHLIIDEADSLFDHSFAPLTSNIINRSSPSLQSLIMSSATIPQSLDEYLRRFFPEVVRLTTPNVHAIPRRVRLSVIDIERAPYHGNRELACADTIWSICRDATTGSDLVSSSGVCSVGSPQKVLVFVNRRETASQVASYLRSKGIDAQALNRDTPDCRNDKSLLDFMSVQQHCHKHEEERGASVPHRQTNSKNKNALTNASVVVMTDIGSRGIDTLAVRHVILYDVPYTTIDFIHRIGRTGRMGRRGRALVLVGKNDRKDVIREVREGMYRGQALV